MGAQGARPAEVKKRCPNGPNVKEGIPLGSTVTAGITNHRGFVEDRPGRKVISSPLRVVHTVAHHIALGMSYAADSCTSIPEPI
jgi:hypothetical protein